MRLSIFFHNLPGLLVRLTLVGLTTGCMLGLTNVMFSPRQSTINSATAAAARARPKFTCPADLAPLTAALLRDLPSYINRINQRTLPRQIRAANYAVVASQPEFTPLPVGSDETANLQDKNLHQVFFTVLERQYVGQQINQLQHYHWLFLAQTPTGWQIALMFSRLGAYPANRQLLTPPRDSSQSITAQAIRLWLRNCQAGAIKP